MQGNNVKNSRASKKMVPKLEKQRVGLVGNQQFVATKMTVRKLMGDQYVLSLCLCLMRRDNHLPTFALSTTSPKELFVESTIFNERLYHYLPGITPHRWQGAEDEKEWGRKKLLIGNNEPLRITFRRCDKEPKSITMIFSHGQDTSAEYVYTQGLDVYFAMFVDYDEFKLGRALLLSNEEFLVREMTMRKAKSLAPAFEPQVCLVCMKELAPHVNLPCGHVTVCNYCFSRTGHNNRCMVCRCEVTRRTQTRVAAPYCTVCPASWNCPTMDTMVLPCRHVVGCSETTWLILTERVSQCPACASRVDQIIKLFF